MEEHMKRAAIPRVVCAQARKGTLGLAFFFVYTRHPRQTDFF